MNDLKEIKNIIENARRSYNSLPLPKEKEEEWRYTPLQKEVMHALFPGEIKKADDFKLDAPVRTIGLIKNTIAEITRKEGNNKSVMMMLALLSYANIFSVHDGTLRRIKTAPPRPEKGKTEIRISLLLIESGRVNITIKNDRVMLNDKTLLKNDNSGANFIVVVADSSTLKMDILEDESKGTFSLFYICAFNKSNVRTDMVRHPKYLRTDIRLIASGESRIEVHTSSLIVKGPSDIQLSSEQEGSSNVRAEVRNVISSYSVVRGRLHIANEAVNSTASFNNPNLLISDNGKAFTIPSLFIDNNRLSAGHSASISRIDEGELFYLMTRGLSKKRAAAVISEGFLKKGIKSEWLRKSIEKFLRGM